MARKSRKQAKQEEYEYITVEVTNFSASVDIGRNYELVHLDSCDSNTRIFRYDNKVEIEGNCIYPDNLKGVPYYITFYGTDLRDDTFSLTLKECQAMNGWDRVYKTVKGLQVPVYELPDSIGFLEKRRGQSCWAGHTWVPPRAVTDMLIMLPHMKPLYLEIHRLKREKLYIMRSVSLMTNNPIDS